VANQSSNTVSILRNNGDGTFGARVDYEVGSLACVFAFGDIDGDGDIDIAVANQSSNTVSILRNNGDGTFGARVDYGVGFYPIRIAFIEDDGHRIFANVVARIPCRFHHLYIGNDLIFNFLRREKEETINIITTV